MNKAIKLGLMSLLIASIVACGWHLRGVVDLPDELRVVAISPDESYTPLQRLLRSLLNASGITVVSLQENPGAIIQILNENVGRRPLTTSLAGDTTENLLSYTINFQVNDAAGNILLPPTRVYTEGTALYNPNDLLGTAEAENIVLDDLRFDAVNQLIQRYAATPLRQPQNGITAEDEIESVEPTFQATPAIQ